MKKKIVIIAVVIVLAFVVYEFFIKKKPPPPKAPAIPVLVGKAVQKTMPVEINTIGTIEPYKTVTVTTRILGQLLKNHFKEGQDVKRGDLLATIDPAPYREALREAEAKLAKDTAQMKFDQDEAKRYAFLLEKGAASKSDYENKQTIADSQRAIVEADKASVGNAKLNLEYCFIRSPLDGRTGVYMVNEGTMIKDADTKLVSINQITPIYARFSVAEKDIPVIRKYMSKKPLKVKVTIPTAKQVSLEGDMVFIDNAVNKDTGMILIKAIYPNKDRFLWPGQFVNVSLILSVEKDAVVVPAQAVQLSRSGRYAFVVKPDMTVRRVAVVEDRVVGEEAVITEGIKAGDTVVTDGQLKLRDGFKVEPRESLEETGKKQQKAPSTDQTKPRAPETEGKKK